MNGTPPDGRDHTSGRFTAGNSFGRGNPHARRQAALRAVLAEAVPEDRLRRIAAKLAAKAEDGDIEACKLLLGYLLGKPGPAPDPDRLDLEEWKLLAAQPTVFEAVQAGIDNIAAPAAFEYVQRRLRQEPQQISERMADDREGFGDVIAVRDKRTSRKRRSSQALPG